MVKRDAMFGKGEKPLKEKTNRMESSALLSLLL